jgi:phage protein D
VVDVSTSAQLSLFFVKIDNVDVSEALMLDLHEVTVETSLCLPGVATLLLNDSQLRWIDEPGLAPGKSLQIAVKLPGGERPLFDGEIVELEPEFGPQTHRLLVRAFDRLHRLTRGRQARSFQQVTDGDLVNKLAAEAGLRAQSAATSVVHPYAFQHNQTNLEVLRERAAPLGYTLSAEGKTLRFGPFAPQGQPLDLRWGVTLQEFQPRLTTLEQVDGVVVRGWDPDNRRAIVGQVSNGHGAPQVGDKQTGGQTAQTAYKQAATALLGRPIRQQALADQLAQATADRLEGQFIEAEGVAGGDPALQAGVAVEIGGVGSRFSGTYLVTSATHTSGLHGYNTRFWTPPLMAPGSGKVSRAFHRPPST